MNDPHSSPRSPRTDRTSSPGDDATQPDTSRSAESDDTNAVAVIQFSGSRHPALADLAWGLPCILESCLQNARIDAQAVLLQVRGEDDSALHLDTPLTPEAIREVTARLRPDYALTGHLSTTDASAGGATDDDGGEPDPTAPLLSLGLEVTLWSLPDPVSLYSRQFDGPPETIFEHLSALHLDLADLLKFDGAATAPRFSTRSFEAFAHYASAAAARSPELRRRELVRAAEADPGYTDAVHALARDLLKEDDLLQAREVLRSYDITAPKPADARVLQLLGLVLERTGEPEAALDVYTRLQEQRPDLPIAIFHIGRTLCILGRLEEAEATLRTFVERSPDRAEGHEHLGVLQLTRGDAAAAVRSLLRARDLDAKSTTIHANLGRAHSEVGDTKAALQAFEAGAKLASPHWLLFFNHAVCLAPTDPERALALYERVLQLLPEHPATLVNMGTLHLRAARYDEARSCWEQVVRAADADAAARQVATRNLENLDRPDIREDIDIQHLSQVFQESRRRGGVEETVRQLEGYTGARDDMWYAWFLLGMARREAGNEPEALVAYKRALDLKPDQPDTLTEMGVIQGQLGLLDQSLANSRRAAELAPDSAAMICNLGVALLRLGKHDDAEQEFLRARDLAPDDPIIENCFEALELSRKGQDIRFI